MLDLGFDSKTSRRWRCRFTMPEPNAFVEEPVAREQSSSRLFSGLPLTPAIRDTPVRLQSQPPCSDTCFVHARVLKAARRHSTGHCSDKDTKRRTVADRKQGTRSYGKYSNDKVFRSRCSVSGCLVLRSSPSSDRLR